MDTGGNFTKEVRWCQPQVIIVGNSSDTLYSFFLEFGRVYGYLGVAVCAFGIISNLANIAVLTRPSMRSPTNTILLWLAVADLLTMIPYLPQLVHFSLLHPPETLFGHTNSYFWICYNAFVVSFVIVCHSAAIWLTVLLGMFRYVYIAQTMRGWPSYANERSARIIILSVFLFSVLLTLPNTIINEIDTCWQNSTELNSSLSSSVVAMTTHKRVKNYVIQAADMQTLQAINFWIQAVVVKIIPCLLMMVTTLVLINQLRVARSRRKTLIGSSSNSREKQDRRTTVMLLSIVVLFILTEFPQGVMLLRIRYDSKFYLEVYMKVGEMIDFVTLCNQAINFILYTSMSKDFRVAFSQNLLQPCLQPCLDCWKTDQQEINSTKMEKECLTIPNKDYIHNKEKDISGEDSTFV